MRFEELSVPFHVTSEELGFARRVVEIIRGLGYAGQIYVVGGREHGFHINTVNFTGNCKDLTTDERKYWYHFLNNMVISQQSNADNIPGLINFLPDRAPLMVRQSLERLECPDADLDILLPEIKRRGKIERMYLDEEPNGSGLAVDVFIGKYKRIREVHDLYLKQS